MPNETFEKILRSFDEAGNKAILSSSTLRERIFNMDLKFLKNYLRTSKIMSMLSENRNTYSIQFLQSVLEHFGTKEFLISHLEFMNVLNILTPLCDEYKFYINYHFFP